MELAHLQEFERIDNRRDLLTDDEYFRWVHLHPQYTKVQKKKFTTQRHQYIKSRKEGDKMQQNFNARLANLARVDTKMAYAKGAVSQSKASASTLLVAAAEMTIRRNRGTPPKAAQVTSAKKITKTLSATSFGTWS